MIASLRERRALRPSSWQTRRARSIVRWYLEHHYESGSDTGRPGMFFDPEEVGHFAITPEEYLSGDPDALFRLLVACAMFQRRQDSQIKRILKGLSLEDAREISSREALLSLVEQSPCPHIKSVERLRTGCDLAKDPVTKGGICGARPGLDCHLKRHTVLLKRYGHFGKVPTSIALMVRERSSGDLARLRDYVVRESRDRVGAAIMMEEALCTAWRVSAKIANMFLSLVSNPDMYDGGAPWQDDLDWTRFIVVDSNVDLFLSAVNYQGAMTSYEQRRMFLFNLAGRIDLAEMRPGLNSFNPRLIQQALYLFMSVSNRRALRQDCSHDRPRYCGRCDSARRTICPSA